MRKSTAALAALVLLGGLAALGAAGLWAAPRPEEPPAVTVPARLDGFLEFVGTEVKRGENVPATLVVTVKVDGEERMYRRLRVGDKVEAGQLLGRLDDELARADLAVRRTKLAAVEADIKTAEAMAAEFKQRSDNRQKLLKAKAIPEEEAREAKLAADRYALEARSKKAELEVGQAEFRRAEILLRYHDLRSRYKGVVKAVLRQPGEAVKAGETVIRIQPDGDTP
jgi:multidrug efflux pump subunit AcrA (membrane-fusion protein)